ncbi:MAG: META domain-containing protein [Barnesiella sp.]
MKKVWFSLLAACACMMFSCNSKKSVSVGDLEGEWMISEVDGAPVTSSGDMPAPFIGFNLDEDRLYGNSGCNLMMGAFSVDSLNPGVIILGPVATTQMACPDMETEGKVLGALNKVKSFEDAGKGRIALCDENGSQVIILTRKTEKDSTAQ